MKHVHGLAFPDADTFMMAQTAPDGSYQRANLEGALAHVTNFGVAIDGGAHVGTWAIRLAARFRHVVAIEPSPDTCTCLRMNLTQAGVTNVSVVESALWTGTQRVTMSIDAVNKARGNMGARRVVLLPRGTVDVTTIDRLALEDVGLIKLDIEGSEFYALQGAKDTLKRCRPVVLFEDKDLWTKYYHLPKNAVATFLTAHGYREAARVSCDAIWVPV